jgi:hypothetical protein
LTRSGVVINDPPAARLDGDPLARACGSAKSRMSARVASAHDSEICAGYGRIGLAFQCDIEGAKPYLA